MVQRYRYRTSVLIGRWRSTRDEALADAVKAKQARHEPDRPDGIAWIVPGRIEADAQLNGSR